MKTTFRIILVAVILLATYFFVYWVPFSLIPGAADIPYLANSVSFVIALIAAAFAWKKSYGAPNSFATNVLLGGLIVGAVGFIAGFFGPLILNPEANQGPLLGIFITGPIGFVAGLIGGAVYWKIKKGKPIAQS